MALAATFNYVTLGGYAFVNAFTLFMSYSYRNRMKYEVVDIIMPNDKLVKSVLVLTRLPKSYNISIESMRVLKVNLGMMGIMFCG